MNKSNSFRIMLTDRDHHFRDLLKRELEKEGYEVSSVNCGIEAFNTIRDSTYFDVVILDPELLYPYGHPLFWEILRQNSTTHKIIYTYEDFSNGLSTGENIHFVRKDISNIGPLKDTIRTCSKFKEGDRN
ncbi:MAG: response regulator [Bacteroidetes bacterium]|nr:response regulator [Bacteroidota bacterium]